MIRRPLLLLLAMLALVSFTALGAACGASDDDDDDDRSSNRDRDRDNDDIRDIAMRGEEKGRRGLWASDPEDGCPGTIADSLRWHEPIRLLWGQCVTRLI